MTGITAIGPLIIIASVIRFVRRSSPWPPTSHGHARG